MQTYYLGSGDSIAGRRSAAAVWALWAADGSAAAPALQPQGACGNAEAAVQDVPSESRPGREHDVRGSQGLHAVPLGDQGG